MGLPFLTNRRTQTMILANKKEGQPMEIPVGEHPMASAAEDLMNAIHAKDVGAAAKALQAAFEIADSEPHSEGEQI